MTFDYCDAVAKWLFQYRNNEELTLRTRFKIQDVIDTYKEDWEPLLEQMKESDKP